MTNDQRKARLAYLATRYKKALADGKPHIARYMRTVIAAHIVQLDEAR